MRRPLLDQLAWLVVAASCGAVALAQAIIVLLAAPTGDPIATVAHACSAWLGVVDLAGGTARQGQHVSVQCGPVVDLAEARRKRRRSATSAEVTRSARRQARSPSRRAAASRPSTRGSRSPAGPGA
jgi:hypothetical protein